MINNLLIAGFGGQGVMTIGKMIGECAFAQGLNVTFLPSYGPEQARRHRQLARSSSPTRPWARRWRRSSTSSACSTSLRWTNSCPASKKVAR